MYPKLDNLIKALVDFLISNEPDRLHLAANVWRLLYDALDALRNSA
jgi:hypothetical protein